MVGGMRLGWIVVDILLVRMDKVVLRIGGFWICEYFKVFEKFKFWGGRIEYLYI